MSLKVAVIGAGSVGKSLAKHIARKHPVVFGVRDPAKYADLANAQNTSVATVSEAVRDSQVCILAVPGSHDDAGIQAIAASLGPDVRGKVVIDATNPLSRYPALEVRWNGKSGGEVLAEALPGAHVFKAFNTIGVEHMAHPDGSLIGGLGQGQALTMLLAGGPEGRQLAEEVVAAVGFQPVYVGPIRYARNLEAIAELWIHAGVPGVGTAEKWGRNFHFQTIRKQP